jgi:predicted DNA-binding transcriptional regulator YafY
MKARRRSRSERRTGIWAIVRFQTATRYTWDPPAETAGAVLAAAARDGKRVWIEYLGGSTPGGMRWVHPYRVFSVDGFEGVFLEAYRDEKRMSRRTFRVDLIRVLDVDAESVRRRPVAASPKWSIPWWAWLLAGILLLAWLNGR